ncbi:MAG: hypothetical protein IV090_27160 [Candidatus Sericytochromatia bacterium]|nr:hypothetical protein [Candidatus Sericytochromatia bacterium]
MERIRAAAICLLLAACQPVSPNPVSSPSHISTSQIPAPQPTMVLPSSTAFPTPIPTYSEEPIPIRTLPPEARPTPLPEPPLLSSALTVLAGSDAPGFQDGKGDLAKFNEPKGLDIDAEGNLYVADTNNHVIRRVSPQGEVITIAGTGQPGDVDGGRQQAQFKFPRRLTLDDFGHIFVIEDTNVEKDPDTGLFIYLNTPIIRRVRKIHISSQKVSNLIFLNSNILKKRLFDIYWHKKNNNLYISGDNVVFEIQTESKVNQITNEKTFDASNVGDYGNLPRWPHNQNPDIDNITVGVNDLLLLTDSSNQILWDMSFDGKPSFFAGGRRSKDEGFDPDGCYDYARFFGLDSVVKDSKGNIFIGQSNMLRKVTPDGCASTVQIKEKVSNINSLFLPSKINDLVMDSKNIIYILSGNKVYKLDLNARAPS